MDANSFKVIPEHLQGKTVEDVTIVTTAVVIKFTDGTFLDIYLDELSKSLKTSTNKLES